MIYVNQYIRLKEEKYENLRTLNYQVKMVLFIFYRIFHQLTSTSLLTTTVGGFTVTALTLLGHFIENQETVQTEVLRMPLQCIAFDENQ